MNHSEITLDTRDKNAHMSCENNAHTNYENNGHTSCENWPAHRSCRFG